MEAGAKRDLIMRVAYGKGTTKYGPGVSVSLSGAEVAIAIDAFLISRNIHISGPRTITVNGELCEFGQVYVDPSGFVTFRGRKISGRGPDKKQGRAGPRLTTAASVAGNKTGCLNI